MKKSKILIPIVSLQYDELDMADKKLVDEARLSTKQAYAPYSHFNVGAAILLDNGKIVTGANQENAAFPSGTCAERTACFYAHAHYPNAKFLAIAIAAYDATGCEVIRPISPCGSCRQALLEYENLSGSNIKIILIGQNEMYILPSVKSLLPFAFTEFQ